MIPVPWLSQLGRKELVFVRFHSGVSQTSFPFRPVSDLHRLLTLAPARVQMILAWGSQRNPSPRRQKRRQRDPQPLKSLQLSILRHGQSRSMFPTLTLLLLCSLLTTMQGAHSSRSSSPLRPYANLQPRVQNVNLRDTHFPGRARSHCCWAGCHSLPTTSHRGR